MIIPENRSLDDFYRATDSLGRFSANVDPGHLIPFGVIYPKTESHAADFAGLFGKLYDDTYPYLEMTDPAHVHKEFKDPHNVIWGMKDKTDGKLFGCLMAQVKENRQLYFRSMGIIPEYRPKVRARPLAHQMVKDALSKHGHRVGKMTSESRTAHVYVQLFNRDVGCSAGALFLNKDYFHHKKESDAFMVGYWEKEFEKRRSPQCIASPLVPFYNYAQRTFNFGGEMPAELPMVKTNPEFPKNLLPLKVTSRADNRGYGYNTVKIEHGIPGNYIKFLHTTTVKNIEKVEYRYTAPRYLIELMAALHRYKKKFEVEYIEFRLRISDQPIQTLLLDMGYLPAGYLPAWFDNPDGTLEDMVVLINTDIFPKRTDLQLLSDGWELFDLIESYKRKMISPVEVQSPFSPIAANPLVS